ncbi:MAG: phosphohydrolase [Bacilli bacterium]|nr:phosphohydrolase [Bacilli bacterium]
MIKNIVIEESISKDLLVVDEYEFEDIAAEFINCEEYMNLSLESHHGTQRLKHSFKVAKGTYIIAKSLGLDYKSATRAAFLHDFFFNDNFPEDIKSIKRSKEHPKQALLNSQKYFNINEKEADAILNHMYPLTPTRPKTLEGTTLSLVDKGVAIQEYILSLGTRKTKNTINQLNKKLIKSR